MGVAEGRHTTGPLRHGGVIRIGVSVEYAPRTQPAGLSNGPKARLAYMGYTTVHDTVQGEHYILVSPMFDGRLAWHPSYCRGALEGWLPGCNWGATSRRTVPIGHMHMHAGRHIGKTHVAEPALLVHLNFRPTFTLLAFGRHGRCRFSHPPTSLD